MGHLTPDIWCALDCHVRRVVNHRREQSRSHFDKLLQSFISKSIWNKFSILDNVVNLSDVVLSKTELELLGFGLNFVFPSNRHQFPEFVLKMYDSKDPFQKDFISCQLGSIYDYLSTFSNGLPWRYQSALDSLRKNKSIHICRADKGGKTVILNREDYVRKMSDIFSCQDTYRAVSSDPLPLMQRNYNNGLKLIAEKYPDDREFVLSFRSFLPSLPYAYGLPKVHKTNCPFRPIIACCNSPSYKLSKTLARHLSPFLGSFSNSHLKNSSDLLNRLSNVCLNPGEKFISFDAISLFTNVPLQPTVDFLARRLSTISHVFPVGIECFLDLIKLCHRHNYFAFENRYFEQIFGLAMGNPLSPVLANLFLEHIEDELVSSFSGVRPVVWLRYADGVLSLVSHDFDLDSFLIFINSLYPTLEFSFELESFDTIPFLDVLIKKVDLSLRYTVHRKSTHSNSYLHFFSFHPLIVKMNVARGQFLRALRICSPEHLDDEIDFIYNSLLKLAYPRDVLNKALSKAKYTYFRPDSHSGITENVKFLSIPFVPLLNCVSNHRLAKRHNTKLVFTYPNSVKSNLIHNRRIKKDCGVYKIPCNDCDKFYLGETGRTFETRLKEHKKAVRYFDVNNALAHHCLSSGHSINFQNSEMVSRCSDFRLRRVVESSFIKVNQTNVLNLNSGFHQPDLLTASRVVKCVRR